MSSFNLVPRLYFYKWIWTSGAPRQWMSSGQNIYILLYFETPHLVENRQSQLQQIIFNFHQFEIVNLYVKIFYRRPQSLSCKFLSGHHQEHDGPLVPHPAAQIYSMQKNRCLHLEHWALRFHLKWMSQDWECFISEIYINHQFVHSIINYKSHCFSMFFCSIN